MKFASQSQLIVELLTSLLMVKSHSMKQCFNLLLITVVTPDLALWEIPLESVKLMGLGLSLQTVKVNKDQSYYSIVVKVVLRT